jgi:hypothetical protein
MYTIILHQMYNGIDLLKFDGSSMSKYVTKLMDILYTKQEMHDGLVIEG